MSEIETNGWVQFSRDKASKKVQNLILSLPEDISPSEKFGRLMQEFQKVAVYTHKCAENFDPGAFEERNLATNNAEYLLSLRQANLLGIHHMEALHQKMQELPLARVNGTSVDFLHCTQHLKTESIRFDDAQSEFQDNILKCMSGFAKRFASVMAQSSAAILFMQEMQVI